MVTLKELAVDYNNISRLPMSFYKLVHLKILRVEGVYLVCQTSMLLAFYCSITDPHPPLFLCAL